MTDLIPLKAGDRVVYRRGGTDLPSTFDWRVKKVASNGKVLIAALNMTEWVDRRDLRKLPIRKGGE